MSTGLGSSFISFPTTFHNIYFSINQITNVNWKQLLYLAAAPQNIIKYLITF